MLAAWDRLEAHMAARKLAAVAELVPAQPRARLPAAGAGADAGAV